MESILVAAGIPTAVLGFFIWLLKRRIERQEQRQDTDPLAVAAYAESLMPGWGGVGRYPVKAGRAKGWVHVDTRPNKSRWTL